MAENRFANIPETEPDELDLQAVERIKKNKDQATIPHEELEQRLSYSGKIALRLPKSLHHQLVQDAKKEGISLNQFILYKLAK